MRKSSKQQTTIEVRYGTLTALATTISTMTDDSNPQKFNLQIIPVTQLQQNAMVFWSTESMRGVLIDPGGEVDRLMEAIDGLNVTIEQIWLTHGHIDHVGGAAESRRRLDCKITGPHRDDQFLLDELKPGTYGIQEAESFTPDSYLNDGDTVAVSYTHLTLPTILLV